MHIQELPGLRNFCIIFFASGTGDEAHTSVGFLFGAKKKKLPDRRLRGKEKIDLPDVKNNGNRKLVLTRQIFTAGNKTKEFTFVVCGRRVHQAETSNSGCYS